MIYYRVKGYFKGLAKDELYTRKEIEKGLFPNKAYSDLIKQNLSEIFDVVEISRKNTVILFGGRYQREIKINER